MRACRNPGSYPRALSTPQPPVHNVERFNPSSKWGIHARQLALEPHLQILRRYSRSLLLRLEYAHRPPSENHVHRITPVGTSVLINETWYNSSSSHLVGVHSGKCFAIRTRRRLIG